MKRYLKQTPLLATVIPTGIWDVYTKPTILWMRLCRVLCIAFGQFRLFAAIYEEPTRAPDWKIGLRSYYARGRFRFYLALGSRRPKQ